MSGFESFSAPESTAQGNSAESFRLFQERVKVASAQIQAIRKTESKQKKKEDDLAKILTDFIKSSQDDQLIEYLTKLLAINMPAVFILSLIFINFPEIQEKAGLKLLDFNSASHAGVIESQTLPDLYHTNRTLPLEIKIAMDSWIAEISRVIHSNPVKILDHALRLDRQIKPEIIDLATYSLNTYLNSKEIFVSSENNYNFMKVCLQGIMSDLIQQSPQLLE